jgi:hypothetical protein
VRLPPGRAMLAAHRLATGSLSRSIADKRNGARRFRQRLNRIGSSGEDEITGKGYQLGRELIDSVEHVASEARLKNDVLTFDVTSVPQPPEQRIDKFTRHIQEKTHAGNFAGPLLRSRRDRPRRRPPEQRDELAPLIRSPRRHGRGATAGHRNPRPLPSSG